MSTYYPDFNGISITYYYKFWYKYKKNNKCAIVAMLLNKNFSFFIFVVLATSSLTFKSTGAVTSRSNHGKLVVCYLVSSSIYRPSRGSFDIDDVDPSLCTHIVYGYAGLNITHDGIISLDPRQDLTDDYGNRGYERVVGLKQNYRDLKVTLSVGGWNQGSANFSDMARDPEKRNRFVASALQFVRKHNFDGLDFNWQFPSQWGGARDDKSNLVLLIKQLRLAFDQHELLLTAVLGTSKSVVDNGYNVRELSNYLDYIHFMSMNYHGAWDYRTGHNAPLRGYDVFNVEYMVNYLINLGAAPSKLIMGIPLFGRTFLVVDELAVANSQNGRLGYPAKGFGFKGPFSNDSNSMGYNEICLKLKNKTAGFKTYWDERSQTPFAISGEKVISYDNERSVLEKVKFAIEKNLGGVMVNSIDTDDFKGDCGTGAYPLLTSINSIITRDVEERVTTFEVEGIPYKLTGRLIVNDGNELNGVTNSDVKES